jgi:transposase-like protein
MDKPLKWWGHLTEYKLKVKCPDCWNVQGFIPRKKGKLYAEITDKQIFKCNKCGKTQNVKKNLLGEREVRKK